MPTIHEQLATSLAVDDAFAFIADFANARHWDPGVATSERLDSGPLDVGARFRLGIRTRGRVAPMEYRITIFDAPRRVQLTGVGSGINAVDDIRFERSGAATLIDYTADIRLGGLMRLLTPFLGGTFARIARDAVGGMQRALDQRARAAAEG